MSRLGVTRKRHQGQCARVCQIDSIHLIIIALIIGVSPVFAAGVQPFAEHEEAFEESREINWLRSDEPTHLYLTCQLLYPQKTRILTSMKRAPLPIICNETQPLRVVLL